MLSIKKVFVKVLTVLTVFSIYGAGNCSEIYDSSEMIKISKKIKKNVESIVVDFESRNQKNIKMKEKLQKLLLDEKNETNIKKKILINSEREILLSKFGFEIISILKKSRKSVLEINKLLVQLSDKIEDMENELMVYEKNMEYEEDKISQISEQFKDFDNLTETNEINPRLKEIKTSIKSNIYCGIDLIVRIDNCLDKYKSYVKNRLSRTEKILEKADLFNIAMCY